MTRKTYTSFRQKELDWGLNLENSPNEIENKQALKCLNFNFEWNKLISSYWKDVLINKGAWNVQGMTVDGWNVYYIQNGNLYKDWIALFLWNSYNVTFSAINWIPFTISIDWVTKWYKAWPFWTENDALTDLLSSLQSDFPTYTISRTGSVFSFSKGGAAISIFNPNNEREIRVSDWNSAAEVIVTIDGVTRSWNGATYATADAFINYLETQYSDSVYYKQKLSVGSWMRIVRKDWAPMTITTSSVDKYTYRFNARTDYLYANTWSWFAYWASTNVTIWWLTTNVVWNNMNVLEGKTVIDSLSLPSGFTFTKSNLLNNIWVTHYVDFYKNDYTAVTTTFFNTYNVPNNNDTQCLSLNTTNLKATISVNDNRYVTYSIVNNGISLSANDLFNITVSSYWILVVWSFIRSWVTFIDWSGAVTQISNATIWQPSVWTIYQWRIVLGWYYKDWKPTDAIVYSKVATPSTPADLLVFNAYPAWAQYVSWGNKWIVTWFIVNEDWLYVFKDNEIYKHTWEKDSWTVFQFVFSKLSSNGALSQSTIAEVWQEIFFYDGINKAIRRLSYEQNLTTLRDTRVSSEVDSFFENIPILQNQLMSVSFKYPNLSVYIPKNDWPNYILTPWIETKKPTVELIYNVDNKSWAERNEYFWEYALFSHKWIVCWDWIYIYDDYVWSWTKNAEWQSKHFDFWDANDYKRMGEVEVYSVRDEGTSLFLDVYIWGTLEESREITSDRFRADLFYEGQFIKIWLRKTGVWKVEINEINIKYKPIMAYNEYN